MSTKQNMLTQCENYIISDQLFANAYESLDASQRALIKTAIAFHFSLQPKQYEQHKVIKNKPDGFNISKSYTLRPFACFFMDKNFASPARLLSLICPALIAGLENIYVFIESGIRASIITTLELCGLEQVYVLENFNKGEELINNSLEFLTQEFSPEQGLIFLLSQNQDKADYQNKIMQFSQRAIIYSDNYNPTINALKQRKEELSFAYGESNFAFQKNTNIIMQSDISFSSNMLAKQNYEVGMELCYLNEYIKPEFFYYTQLEVKMFKEEF